VTTETRRSKLLLYIPLTAIGLLLILPLLWMVSTSLKQSADVYAYPPSLIPPGWHWINYLRTIQTFPFFLYLRNSVILTVVATVGTILSSSLVAFGFARRRFPGRGLLFGVLLGTLMLPSIITLIPTFVLFSKLHWVNTFLPLTVPTFLGGNAFSIFLLRQYYLTLSFDYDEAAYMDGASSLRVWWQIIIPLSKGPLTVVAILSILAQWNNFLGPLIYMNSPNLRTLAVGLQYFSQQELVQVNYMMAAATLMTVPMLLLFFGAQRYFVRGLSLTGLGGR
jgi:multiple sugar transport system permease protein